MPKRKPDNPAPVAPRGDNQSSPTGPPHSPPAKHGPAAPAPTLYGLAHLRAVQSLSPAVPVDQVCEESALDLTRLRAEQRPRRWTDSDRV